MGETLDDLNDRIPLVEHFDGTAWRVVPVPHVTGGELFDIAVVSPSDIWAVGGTASAALTMHFDGKQWKRVAAPVAALFGVAALSTNDVWAVGIRYQPAPSSNTGMVFRGRLRPARTMAIPPD